MRRRGASIGCMWELECFGKCGVGVRGMLVREGKDRKASTIHLISMFNKRLI